MLTLERPTSTADRPGQPCPRCYRRHRGWRSVAKCRWPKAVWISGSPPYSGPCYASVSYCHPGCTVMLLETFEEARQRKVGIDRLACGGRCMRAHRNYHLGTDQ